MRSGQWRVVLGLSLMAACGLAAASSPITPHTEYHKRIRTGEMVSPLSSELFGEKISLSSGSTEFVVTDIDLPGNNALPVRLQRRFAVQTFKDREPLGGFGMWDVDVPYLQGTFEATYKWNTGGNGATQRCGQPFYPRVPDTINLYEVWSGNTAHIPGEGDQELLYLGGATTTNPRPTDGAVYNWGTRGALRFSCLPATANGYPGEGFLGVDGNGNRYFFNVGIERWMGGMDIGSTAIGMIRVYLMASRVEDRHGNWVAYDYSNGKLAGIRGSDGRSISLAYAGDRIASATANGRTWNYEYNERASALGFGHWPSLRAVVQPDGTRFGYEYSPPDDFGGLNPEYEFWDGNPDRCTKPGFGQSTFTLVATHPAGTRGQYDFEYVRRSRTGIGPHACGTVGGRYYQRTAGSIDLYAIRRKTLTGPGLETQVWSYERGGYDSGIADVSVATLVEPDGTRRHSVFGIKVDENEGQLLQEAVRAPDGQIIQVRSNAYVNAAEAASMPFPDSYGLMSAADAPFSTRIRPLKQSVLNQDGVNFVNTTDQFDVHARPVVQTEGNSLGRSRVLKTTYFDDTGRWILGQVARSTQTVAGAEIETERTEFDNLSRPQRTYAFGVLQQALVYRPDGTLASLADGRGNAIALDSWKRGLPQSVGFPDGSSATLQVDDNGWVRNAVEPNGASRSFDYDGMGRIVQATQAAGDSVAWNPSTTHFYQVTSAEVGLEGGHWKRESSTGNARAVTYYDGLWRPVLDESFDVADRSGTLRQTVTRYDSNGRAVFASYPTRSASDFRAALPGTYSSYDALGRIVRNEQDSELGRLVTTTQQLGGGSVKVTNPRGIATTTDYLMYGMPSQDMPARILHPEGAVTEIQRDALGKPLSILRRSTDGSISLRRQYVYDGSQRLCKSMEPESGATVVGYDAVGNVVWSASGLALLGPQCDSDVGHASASRADRTYDSMNRLLTLRFSDGQGDQDWSYWPGGQVKRVQTRNGEASTINEYTYNLRGLPTSETVIQDGGGTWALGYGYDPNGALSTHLQPSGLTIDYGPNALGQPTRAGPFASDVRYYPNGGMSSFAYGNGVIHQMTQNARGLPDRSFDSGVAGKVIDDGYDYDANGNVAAISDGLPGAPGNRDMRYDGLDRLVAVTATGFGDASYAYNVLDNLELAAVGTRRQALEYDHNNRLTNVRDTNTGATVTGLGYDPKGNLSVRNGIGFRFDHGNRLREVVGKEHYQYDAHGRRVLAAAESGTIRSMYGQDGVLRYQHDQRQAKAFDYVTLNGSLVAKRATDILPAALVVRGPGYSNDGNFVVQWNAVAGALRYEIQEADGSSWEERYQGPALSTTISNRSSGSYRYRGRVCTAAGCGAWGSEAVVQVERAPSGGPTLSAPVTGLNGNYVVSWSQVPGAEHFVLDELAEGSWLNVYSGTQRSLAIAGKPAGTYGYRVKACNPQGCGAYSSESLVRVLHAPAVPALSAPVTSYNGAFSIAVTAVAGATSYTLDQQSDGAGWTELIRTSATTVPLSGQAAGRYGYRASACNEAGCSSAGNVVYVQVTLPPTATPTISLAPTVYSSTISMSWSGVGAATYYQVVERANGGGFVQVYQDAATSAALGGRGPAQWEYQVRGCNEAGCGPWSALAGVRVIGPPAAPQVDLPAMSGTGVAYVVSVSQVADATGYELDESQDGVNWAMVSVARTFTTSKNGGTYYYRARGCNPAGCGASSATRQIAVSSAPPVPTGVRISIRTSTRCQVTWGDSPGASRYEILEGRTGMTYGSDGVNWETDMRCAGPYKVRACNSQACSAWSAGVN